MRVFMRACRGTSQSLSLEGNEKDIPVMESIIKVFLKGSRADKPKKAVKKEVINATNRQK